MQFFKWPQGVSYIYFNCHHFSYLAPIIFAEFDNYAMTDSELAFKSPGTKATEY